MASLLQAWLQQKDFLRDKSISQIVAVTSDGVIKDGSATSIQLREFFSHIKAEQVSKYVEECLNSKSFEQNGFVLQDLVNQAGSRLGFDVEYGLYRGIQGKIGFDGIWRAKDGYAFVVEVKSNDNYNFSLDTHATYRKKLIQEGKISEAASSILLVVGNDKTGALEAQTRGSKHAWDVRIISAASLVKLMRLKEELSDQKTVLQIQEILKPHEYTRVDRLVEVLFSASEDIQEDNIPDDSLVTGKAKGNLKTYKPSYIEECVSKIASHLKQPLIRQGRCYYGTVDKGTKVLVIVSKEYDKGSVLRYWFTFRPSHKEFLQESSAGYAAFCCGGRGSIILIPYQDFEPQLTHMRKTLAKDQLYWHVEIFKRAKKYLLTHPSEKNGFDVSPYLL